MSPGITNATLIAVYKEPDDRSEMVSQLLFGESYVRGRTIGLWTAITCHFDETPGWIKKAAWQEMPENQHTDNVPVVAQKLLYARSGIPGDPPVPILPGSELHHYNPSDGTFTVGTTNYQLNGIISGNPPENTREAIVALAEEFINAPELKGGRSLFGIDAPGLVQIVYKMAGTHLPRTAHQQVEQGRLIPFIHDARPGDLAFFENDRGVINHVGILLDLNTIIHTSGCVRKNAIDHLGIRKPGQADYSHKLRVIKSIL